MEKNNQYLGTEPLGKLLFKLAVPSVVAQIINMLYNIVDRIYIGHMPGQMSGGQQQRVGIARALVTDPDIIFADEPTGNLDSKTSDDVMHSMCDTVKSHGKTFIMVTHDPNMAAYADKVINILDGRITDIYFNRHETVGDKAEISEEIKKEA